MITIKYKKKQKPKYKMDHPKLNIKKDLLFTLKKQNTIITFLMFLMIFFLISLSVCLFVCFKLNENMYHLYIYII